MNTTNAVSTRATRATFRLTTPTDREIVLTREFDAPRHLVFKALTTPELLKRWLGPSDWTLATCEIDLRVGGAWRQVHRGPDGSEMGMRGVYREVSPPARLVTTEAFDGWAEGEAIVTTSLTEHASRTTMTTTVLYPSREVRDGMLSTEMERGVGEGYDRLEELLALAQIVERYRKRADSFEGKVAAVAPHQWANQSPCAEWTARDVVDHIVMMHDVMLRRVDRSLSAAPAVTDDPLGAFRAARADVEALLDDPALGTREVDTPIGSMTAVEHVDRVVSADMPLHGWDLSRATGQDDTIDPDEIVRARRSVEAIPEEMWRMPGVIGPALKAPADADEQTKLLAFLGRKAW